MPPGARSARELRVPGKAAARALASCHQRLSAPSAGSRRVETLQVRRLSDPGGISDERAHVEAQARLQQPCAPARAEREWEIVQPAPPLIGRSPHRSTNPRRAESRVRSARRYEKCASWMGMIL